MHRLPLIIISLLFSGFVIAMPVPDDIEITPENVEQLGFHLDINSAASGTEARLVFPQFMHGTWPARRAQSYLYEKGGDQIFVSSSDYLSGQENPSILTFYNHRTHDLSFSVQYFCQTSEGAPCEGAESYSVKSVSGFLITSHSSRTPASEASLN